ncbi:MAG: 50S ribosomal protein L11 methyltransferase [Candidatus Omnitrophica bacterium]|nr:50S ribosomal protein L11 methyltransferase [Candidatus Omnitrophota bacterium]
MNNFRFKIFRQLCLYIALGMFCASPVFARRTKYATSEMKNAVFLSVEESRQLGAEIIRRLSIGDTYQGEILYGRDDGEGRVFNNESIDFEYDYQGKYVRLGPLVFLNTEKEGFSWKEIYACLGEEFLKKYGRNIIFYVSPDNHWQSRIEVIDFFYKIPLPFIDFTTLSAIVGMLKNGVQDKVVADIGSGFGILSLVALRLGAKEIFAVEAEEYCLEKAEEIIRLNGYRLGIDGEVKLFHHTVTEEDIYLGLPQEVINRVELIISNTGPYYYRLPAWIIEQAAMFPSCRAIILTHYKSSRQDGEEVGESEIIALMKRFGFAYNKHILFFPIEKGAIQGERVITVFSGYR